MNIHVYFFKMPISTALCIFNYGRKFLIDWLYPTTSVYKFKKYTYHKCLNDDCH